MTDRIPMTPVGYEKLKAELHHIKVVDRPTNITAIEEARAHGDISENAEFHAAKERQSFLEGRIKEIESKLAQAEIIDPKSLKGDRIVFGATVTLMDAENEEEKRYQIVGVDEADLKAGKISVTSPIARGLINKRVGDEVTITTPAGKRHYEVLAVEFA